MYLQSTALHLYETRSSYNLCEVTFISLLYEPWEISNGLHCWGWNPSNSMGNSHYCAIITVGSTQPLIQLLLVFLSLGVRSWCLPMSNVKVQYVWNFTWPHGIALRHREFVLFPSLLITTGYRWWTHVPSGFEPTTLWLFPWLQCIIGCIHCQQLCGSCVQVWAHTAAGESSISYDPWNCINFPSYSMKFCWSVQQSYQSCFY